MKIKKKFYNISLILCSLALIIVLFFNIFIIRANTKFMKILINSGVIILLLCLILSFIFKIEMIFKLSTVLSILFLVLYLVFLGLKNLGIIEKISSFSDIRNFILKYNKFGILIYTLINFLQVVILPLPSSLTILVGTAIYGPFKAFLFSYIGIILGSIVAFLVGRYCSRPLLYWIFGKENVLKYEKILSKRTELILFFTLILPFFPDDMICSLSGITSIKFKNFLLILLIARLIATWTLAFFGSGSIIPFNTWWGILIWGILATIVIISVVIFIKKRKKIVHLFFK